MSEKIRVLLSEEEVDSRIREIAAKISRDYAGKEIHLICVLKGGVFFTCELAKRITVPVTLDFMSVSSYGDDTKSSGVVKIVKDLDQPLEGKNVLIVEDIIDSGRTLSYLIDILGKRKPESIHLCTLLDKPERRVRDVKVDYSCFNIPGKNVLIVEDIIDSGRTLSYLIDILGKRKPESIHLCTLLDKPERRVRDVKVDYSCFNIPDEFVVGYGLDYAQKYRNLPFIGVVELGEN